MVADYKSLFEKAKGIVLTDYTGLSVLEMTEFRAVLRKSDIKYRVVKNTLARIAADGTPAEAIRDYLNGPVGIAMHFEDSALPAKEVVEYASKSDKLKVTCGVVDGSFCDEAQLVAISKLPSRDVLLGMIAGTMNAPATKMAMLLNATVTQFAYALNALKEKKAA